MRSIVICLSLIVVNGGCYGQEKKFEKFISAFPLVNLPVDSVPGLKAVDTLDVGFFNDIVWESQPEEEINGKRRITRPKVYKNKKLVDMTSFGKVSDTPMNYRSVDGTKGQFLSAVYAICRLQLHSEYFSLIVKTYNSELAYYDLYNFTKDGKRLSAIPLFTYAHNKMLVDSIDYIYTKSSILKDGSIVWFENNRGLKTSRIYMLRDDGYFEIVEEERTGEFEY